MSVLTLTPKENEDRIRRLEALERQIATDILRLWKRVPETPDSYGANAIAAQQAGQIFVEPEEVTGTIPFSGGTGPAASQSATQHATGGSGGGSGLGLSGGTPDLSGGTLQTGGTLTGGTFTQQLTGGTTQTGGTQVGGTVTQQQTGGQITGGTFTGQGTGGTQGTPQSGINTGQSGGGSGFGLTGGTSTQGTAHSGTQISGVCYGPLFWDTFDGVGGLQLAYHTPDFDKLLGGWQGDTLQLQINGVGALTPRDAPSAVGTTEYRANVNVGEKNVYLTATGANLGNANGGTNRFTGFIVRYVSDLDHWILRVNVASELLEIIEVNGGTRTVRASAAIPSDIYGSTSTMTAIVRDTYIRFSYGNRWVSYGSATYLQGAGRHGIYMGFTGTVNTGQQTARIDINCLPADESGTGLSGSRSESHLSGGGASGGTSLTQGTGLTQGTTNTGGTPVGSGGTLIEYVSIPTSTVTNTWGAGGNVHGLLDECTTWSTTASSDPSDRAVAGGSDDNEELVLGMSIPLPSGFTVKEITLRIWSEGDTGSITVERRVKINGSWQTADSDSVAPGATTQDNPAINGTWSGDTLTLEAGIKPLTIAKSNNFYLRAVLIRLRGWA